MAKQSIDILLVGGGLTGASLLLALKNQGYSTLLIDSNAPTDRINEDFDARTLALSPASIRILQQLDVWSLLSKDATPLHHLHVSEQGRFGAVSLDWDEQEALGFILEMQHINKALYELLDQNTLLAPAELTALDLTSGIATVKQGPKEHQIQAKLIVAADGTHSTVRRLAGLEAKTTTYGQQAIVTNIGLKRSHGNVAYERFTSSGPMAMLPMRGNRSALIWALTPADAKQMMDLSDTAFLQALQKAFGYRLGRFIKVGKRNLFPLERMVMPKQVAWPLVFVGNAAHTIHPVAGQGFNLGLRDVATLAEQIVTYGLNEEMLSQYELARASDQSSIIQLTDGLVNLFTSPVKGLGILRSLGLTVLEHVPVFKKVLSHYAGGFSGDIPDLVCGIPLKKAALIKNTIK